MSDKIRTKRFWISLIGIVIMLLELFGLKVDAPYVNEIVSSICAVCVVIGLLDGGTKNEGESSETSQKNKEESTDSEQKDERSDNEN